jgi:hypothetical protein
LSIAVEQLVRKSIHVCSMVLLCPGWLCIHWDSCLYANGLTHRHPSLHDMSENVQATIMMSYFFYFYVDARSINWFNSAALCLALEKQLFIISGSHIDPPLLCTYNIMPSVSNIILTISFERLSSLSVGSERLAFGFAKMQNVDENGIR